MYSPTQEAGQDGHILYRKSGESGQQALCIEHFEGQWQVKKGLDQGSRRRRAYFEGGSSLENCSSRHLLIWDGDKFAKQPSVNIVTAKAAAEAAA